MDSSQQHEHDAPAQQEPVVDDGPDEGGEVQQPDPSIGESIKDNPAEGYDPDPQV